MAQIKPLPEQLQKIAIDELGEVPARIPEDLQALKTWIEQQPHLKARTDDQFLIQFLRGCKYSLEKAKDKLDHFYAMKTKWPDLFLLTDVDKSKFRQFHNTGCCVVLPTPLNDCGPRIIMMRFTYSSQDFVIDDNTQHIEVINEILLQNDPYACIYGVMYILDYALVTSSHLAHFTPSVVKKLTSFYAKTLPLRIKAICLVNLSTVAEQFIKMLLVYLPEKLKRRIFVCGKNLADLNKHVPIKYLPRDYGGENGTLEHECAEYNKVFDEYREYFKQNADYGTNERLRIGKSIDFDGDLGCGGSFRKLNVD